MINIPKSELKMPEERFGSVAPEEHSSGLAVILGFLIVCLMFILGGLYFWGQQLQQPIPVAPEVPATRPSAEENNEPESTNAEAAVETMSAVSTSDEIDAIASDLEATHVYPLDADISAIEAEFNKTR